MRSSAWARRVERRPSRLRSAKIPGAATRNGAVHSLTDTSKRPAYRCYLSRRCALAVALTLVLGLLGGALLAGWEFTSPARPLVVLAPSPRAPRKGRKRLLDREAFSAPATNDVEARRVRSALDPRRVSRDATKVPGTPSALPILAAPCATDDTGGTSAACPNPETSPPTTPANADHCRLRHRRPRPSRRCRQPIGAAGLPLAYRAASRGRRASGRARRAARRR